MTKILFIGNNFYGIGGVETSALSLAEEFAVRGYEVEMLSMKRVGANSRVFPEGVVAKRFYDKTQPTWKDKLKHFFIRSKRHYSYALDTTAPKYTKPYSYYALRKYLRRTDASIIMVEDYKLTPFVHSAENRSITNRFYFFHGHSSEYIIGWPVVSALIDSPKESGVNCKKIFDDWPVKFLKKHVSSLPLDTAVFVSDYQKKVFDDNGVLSYQHSLVLGNAASRQMIVPRDQISPVAHKTTLQGVCASRITSDRLPALLNLVDFAKYIKQYAGENVPKIQIDIYGEGDSMDGFFRYLNDADVAEIIQYKGVTTNTPDVFKNHDFVLNFREDESFGYTFLEAILGGKMIFATRSEGAEEIFDEYDDVFFNDFDDLYQKIINLPNMPKEQLLKLYDHVLAKYAPEKVVDKLEALFE
jgi:glycosyltransferase involved in cell wall biosynthesis